MEKAKKKFAVPHTYILLLILILVFSILSYIIPAGVYDIDVYKRQLYGLSRF